MASTDGVELVWRAGPYAVVWKVSGVPLADEAAGAPACGGKGGAGRGARGGKGAGAAAHGGAAAGRSPPGARGGRGGQATSVAAWAKTQLDGMWDPVISISVECAGLVLLARTGLPPPPPVQGTYAVLAAPRRVPPEAAGASAAAGAVEALFEPLGLWGGVDEEARVVQEVPSGHFGRLALVEVDVPVSGAQASSALSVALSLQELGFGAVVLPSAGSRHDPQLTPQVQEQGDVLAGTCMALVALCLPEAVRSHAARPSQRAPDAAGRLVHAPPGRFAKLLESERTLAGQRQRPADSTAVFRGLQLLVPEEQLRPRASSGALVDTALDVLVGVEAPAVLDLGAGCGALLLALLKELRQRGGEGGGAPAWAARGDAVDIDEGAVRTCRENALRVLGAEGAAQVGVVQADFSQLDAPAVRSALALGGYDVILCNPPYRSEAQQEAYDRATGQFGGHTEHARTLVAGKTGLEMYEAIAACLARDAAASEERGQAPGAPQTLLKADGVLIFQVEAGSCGKTGGMAAVVGSAVEKASGGWLQVRGTHVDERGLERAVVVAPRTGRPPVERQA